MGEARLAEVDLRVDDAGEDVETGAVGDVLGRGGAEIAIGPDTAVALPLAGRQARLRQGAGWLSVQCWRPWCWWC